MTAINVEASGFRGQRLLVEASAVPTSPTIGGMDGTELSLVRRLQKSLYPTPACDGFKDVLWMVPDHLDGWEAERIKMFDRLRWAAKDADESAQAAATMLVFAEVEAMLHGLEVPAP